MTTRSSSIIAKFDACEKCSDRKIIKGTMSCSGSVAALDALVAVAITSTTDEIGNENDDD